MNIDSKAILSWICIIGGTILFILVAGDLLLRILGSLIAVWIINYGLMLNGTTFNSLFIGIKSKFKK